MKTLEQQWNNLCAEFSTDSALIHTLFSEIKSQYNSPKRFYHNLNHIQALLNQAEAFKTTINNYHIVCFAIWYHDIIYSTTKHNNEIKSAETAIKRLKQLKLSDDKTELCGTLIRSTQNHKPLNNDNDDNRLLLDFDLDILGAEWNIYLNYTQNIRKEYGRYPNFIYKKGRKKALRHFLERERIYHSNHYFNEKETRARENINRELEIL